MPSAVRSHSGIQLSYSRPCDYRIVQYCVGAISLFSARKSGKPRVLPLLYQKVDAGFLIIASKGGARTHPAWYLNLRDNPDCEIRVGRDHYRVNARTSEGEERAELWKVMTELYPTYDEYQASTDREIPVVVLEPVG